MAVTTVTVKVSPHELAVIVRALDARSTALAAELKSTTTRKREALRSEKLSVERMIRTFS